MTSHAGSDGASQTQGQRVKIMLLAVVQFDISGRGRGDGGGRARLSGNHHEPVHFQNSVNKF